MSLIFNIAVTGNPIELNYRTYQAIQKRLEYVRYGQQVLKRDIPLEYVGFEKLSANESLFIKDLSANFSNNNTKILKSFKNFEVFSGKNYLSETKSLLITNKVKILENGDTSPLFYSHSLPEDTVNVSIQLVTNDGTSTISTSNFETNEDKTVLFANFLNSFDEVSGRYKIYYVQSVDSSGSWSSVIYNPEPAFHEATFDDIDPLTNTLLSTSNAYIINTTGSNYTFTLPINDTYYIKQKDINRIQLIESALQEPDDSWFIRIANGDFSQNISGTNYSYFIEEYGLQLFVPSAPTKFSANENAIIITNNLIKLQRETIKIDLDLGLNIELIISDKKDGTILYALTTDTSKEGDSYSNTSINYDIESIVDWDEYTGIVRIDGISLLDNYEVKASYFYDSTYYEYTNIELNPYLNSNILNKVVVIYMVPNVKGSEESALYHLIVQDNIILECSQTGGTIVPNLSRYSSDGSINSNSVVGIAYESNGTSGAISFEDLYPNYFILGNINITEPRKIKDAVRIDIRQSGGGIDKDYLEDAIKSNARIAYIPGIGPFGGYPYPEQASHVIKIPYTVLTDYGGSLSKDIVRTKVMSSMSAGEYPIIEFSGVIPNIYEIIPDTCITLRWYRENPIYTFKIYRSLNIDTGFSLLTEVNPSSYENNEYIDCSVESGIGYYYYITAYNTETGIESPKSTIWGARAL